MRPATLTLTLLALAAPTAALADDDYRFEVGGGVGMTGYLGDANSTLFATPGLGGEAVFRYKPSPRFSLKTTLSVSRLRGDSSKSGNWLPTETPIRFSTTPIEIGETAEFNFFNYGMGESYRRMLPLTPYIAMGLGISTWSIGGNLNAALNIPMGCGLRYKPAERWNLGVEFMMKKVFTDRLDSPALDDPYGIKSSFMKNTDWHSALSVSVTYEFGQRCEACNYKE